MEQYSQVFLEFITTWGYVAVVVLMAMESACLPVPSELILGFAGYLVFQGCMDAGGAIIAGVAGGLAGSVIAYQIGYHGGRPLVNRYGKYILLSHRHVEQAQAWFDRYGLKAAFFSRLLPVVRTFISLPAGFAKVDFKRFVLYTVLGSLPWTIALVYAGKTLGSRWSMLNDAGHRASLLVVIILVLGGGYFWYRSRQGARQD